MNSIPEGATHEANGLYYKKNGGTTDWSYWSPKGQEWRDNLNPKGWAEESCKPIRPAAVTAPSILEAAAGHMKDRAATYDKPEGERSMVATVQAFKAVTGHELTEEQGWLFMQLLKAVRSQQGAYRADSYEDGAAYVALAGEAAARDRQGGQP